MSLAGLTAVLLECETNDLTDNDPELGFGLSLLFLTLFGELFSATFL